jgi:D-alanine-D-alanine ligase
VERYRQSALVEEYIHGRELNVAILGNRRPVALPVSEIDMRRVPTSAPRICDYRAKWVAGSREYDDTVPVCPAPLRGEVERTVKDIALRCYRLLSCRGYARVDMRLDRSGIPYVLEVNPNPCIDPDSGMVRSAAAAGISYRDLVCMIADLALRGDEALRGLS